MVFVDVNADLDNFGLMDERRAFNRKLLVFAHILVGAFSAAVYLNRVDLAGFPYWASRSGLGVIFMAAPALVPYAVSAVYSWRVATHRRLRLFFFLIVLVGLSVLMGLLISGALGAAVQGPELVYAAGAQAGIYLWAAELLLHVV